MKNLTLRILCLFILACTSIGLSAKETFYFSPFTSYKIDNNNEVETTYHDKYLTVEFLPRINTQPELIRFTWEDAKDSNHPRKMMWLKQGLSKYHYTYKTNKKGVINRFLAIFTSEYPSLQIIISCPKDYKGWAVIDLEKYDENGNFVSADRSILKEDECENFFKLIARQVEKLNFSKTKNDTLSIDVDY